MQIASRCVALRWMARGFAAGLLVAAGGCSMFGGKTPGTSPTGPYLVYRTPSGAPSMQFDYPSEAVCLKVEQLARGPGRKVRCEWVSAAQTLGGRALLRYDPPGLMVTGHYADMTACLTQTMQPAPGVEVVERCSLKEASTRPLK